MIFNNIKNTIIKSGIALMIFTSICCNNSQTTKDASKTDKSLTTKKSEVEKATPTVVNTKTLKDFLPKGFILFDKVYGDLNKDGSEDCILIIKATDKNKIIKEEYRGILDRNRRGIIVLFNKNGSYEMAVKNENCFSSENEDGGVYFAPELDIQIVKGNLSVHYGHGRYGYWSYTFRFQNSDFELIGYDQSNGGVVIDSETSINFLTGKKISKVNINENSEGGDEIFKQTITKINKNKLIKLSEIKDFDELEIPEE